MKTLGNILWHFPFFGFVSAIFVYLLGLLLTATVVAAPVGLGLMEFGKFLFWPFGNAMVSKSELNAEQNKAWKAYSTIIMVLYFPFGLLLCIGAIIQVVFLFLSIIGIPAAIVVAKSLGTYLNPVNKKCVHGAVSDELERRKGQQQIDKHLGTTSNATAPTTIEAPVIQTAIPQPQIQQLIDTQTQQSQAEIGDTASFSDRLAQNKKKLLIGGSSILGLVALFVLYTWFSPTWSYSTGERTGYVQKLSNKGFTAEAWMGEMAMVTMPGTPPEIFWFTVRTDSIAAKINASLGKRVKLTYEQHSETEYFVTHVEVVNSSGSEVNSPVSNVQSRFPFTGTRLLSISDLSGLSKQDLKIMRNEIFARHGYIFKTPDMKSYFATQSWYHAQYDDVTSMLSNIEQRNVALVKKYE